MFIKKALKFIPFKNYNSGIANLSAIKTARRKEKIIKDRSTIDEILLTCTVCRIGTIDGLGRPYIVPVTFVADIDTDTLYFHSAKEGKKVDCFEKHNYVFVQMDIDEGVDAKFPLCDSTHHYKSLMAEATISSVEDLDEQKEIFSIYFEKFGMNIDINDLPQEAMDATAFWKVEMSSISGKQS